MVQGDRDGDQGDTEEYNKIQKGTGGYGGVQLQRGTGGYNQLEVVF